jgi:predicted TIM-barrel enzyme
LKIKDDDFQVGVQIMINALEAALAIVKVFHGSFLRCAALMGKMVTGSGTVEANPYEFQKYRRYLDAFDVKLIAEIDGMHFKWINNEKTTAEVAQYARYSGANAVEVAAPDEEENQRKVMAVKQIKPEIPVVLGGYTNHENVSRRLANADGAFVGTCFEKSGWGSNIDEGLVKDYITLVNKI